MKQIENKTLRTLAEYGIITGSIWIMVIGIYFFKFPNNFAFGGVTGFATVVSAVTHWSASPVYDDCQYGAFSGRFYFFRARIWREDGLRQHPDVIYPLILERMWPRWSAR